MQYNETAFAFVSRLMEDEGIYYFFEHADGKHTLVLADDSGRLAAVPGAGHGRLRRPTRNWEQQNVVTGCDLEQRVISGKSPRRLQLRDPVDRPAVERRPTVATDGAKRRIYEYPGGFIAARQGEARAKLRIEAAASSRRRSLRGDEPLPGLPPRATSSPWRSTTATTPTPPTCSRAVSHSAN